MKKKAISLLLVLCMVLTLPQTGAFAAGVAGSVTNEEELLQAIAGAVGTPDRPAVVTVSQNIELSGEVGIEGKNILIRGLTGVEKIWMTVTPPEETNNLFLLSGTEQEPCNVTLESIVVDGCGKARLFYLSDSFSTLVMNDGSILQNGVTLSSQGNGAAVNLVNGASFIMNAGLVTKNTSGKYGGGISTWNGHIEIRGGTISENVGTYAGGVVSLGGTLTLRGGQIIQNHGRGSLHGGGVFMNGGVKGVIEGNVIIADNTAGDDSIPSDFYLNGYGDSLELAAPFVGQANLRKLYDDRPSATHIGAAYVSGGQGYQITSEDLSHFAPTAENRVFYLDGVNNQIMLGVAKTITFADNFSDTEPHKTQKVAAGISTALAVNPYVRTGYTFTGWNTEPSGGGTAYADGADITISEELTLHAQWKANEYAITYVLNGGTLEDNAPLKHTYDAQTTLTEPSRAAYTFGGWYPDSSFTGVKLSALGGTEYTDAITLYAKWEKEIEGKRYTVLPVIPDQTYTGAPLKPAVTVLENDVPITEGYTVAYTDNVNVGTATAVVRVGEVEIGTATFQILPAPPAPTNSSPSKPTAKVTGEGGKVKVTGTTVTITPDEGYQIATVTVNGKKVDIPADGKLTKLRSTDKVVVTFEISDAKILAPFADLTEGDWANKSIAYVVRKGLFKGVDDLTFAPDALTSRAMLFTVLARMEGHDFAPGDTWYSAALTWAVEQGITDGANPEGDLSREQLAAMLYRYAGSPAATGMALSEFADENAASPWAEDALRWCVGAGILTGTPGGLLAPQGSATRAEVAAMLMRYMER